MTDDFYLYPFPIAPHPTLNQYTRLAQDFHQACESPNDGAIRQWAERSKEELARLLDVEITPHVRQQITETARQIEPRWQEFRNSNAPAGPCTRAGAQLFIAKAHGFANWPKFAAHVEELGRANTPVSNFESAVDRIVSGDAARLTILLSETPELVRMRSNRVHASTLLHYVSANGVEGFRQTTPPNIVRIAELLLDAGADVNAESDAYGGQSTTLELTATSCHPENAGVQLPLLELLLGRGATMDGTKSGSSVVVSCLKNGRAQAARYLASRGARLNLEGAAGIGRLDVVQSFFDDNGAPAPPATGQQAIDGFVWACEYGHISVADFLIQKGLQVDAQSTGGATGLHWAAWGAHRNIVSLLLEHQARVDVIDERYQATPLGWAMHGWFTSTASKPYPEVVSLLVRAGALPDPAWLDGSAGQHALAGKIRSDPHMHAALRGHSGNR